MDVAAETVPPLEEPEKHPRFPLSQALSTEQVAELMGARYCRLIGILGSPNAGKTAALVSLYLLLSRDKLGGIHFADSRTLMALDEISHGARRWNEGALPEQLTVHTEMADERTAGYLHLRLSQDDGDPIDLLLPDLPGEWTTALIDKGRSDRMQFLRGADLIWIMVDGQQLSGSNSRQYTLHRTKLLIQRLVGLVRPKTPLFLVITRRDVGPMDERSIRELQSEAVELGFTLVPVEIASFSDQPEIEPGTGIQELMSATISSSVVGGEFWPDATNGRLERAIMRFRRREKS